MSAISRNAGWSSCVCVHISNGTRSGSVAARRRDTKTGRQRQGSHSWESLRGRTEGGRWPDPWPFFLTLPTVWLSTQKKYSSCAQQSLPWRSLEVPSLRATKDLSAKSQLFSNLGQQWWNKLPAKVWNAESLTCVQ